MSRTDLTKGAPEMLCPNCQAEVREDAAFCGACGATLQEPPVVIPPPAPGVAAPVPQAEVPAAAVQDTAEYERQLAEYERQKAAYDQQQYAQQMAAYQQQSAPTAPAPVKKRKTGLIVAIAIIAVLLVIGCGIGGVLALRTMISPGADSPLAPATDTEDPGQPDGVAGYVTAEEAVLARMADEDIGDWVYQLYDEADGSATYWVGPPASEWVYEIVVERASDGSWSATGFKGLDFGGDVSDMGPSAEAEFTVIDHLTAVMEDRGDDAQGYTVDPFRSDSTSAQVSAGGFDSFDITGVTEQSDGSYWVATIQVWHGSSQNWEYWVVPTELGYRIADVRPW